MKFTPRTISREERDALRQEIAAYSAAPTPMRGWALAGRIEPLVPVAPAPVQLLGQLAAHLLPAAEMPLRVPVIEGHAEALGALFAAHGDPPALPADVQESFLEEYGLTVPGDLAKHVMRWRRSRYLTEGFRGAP